MVMVAVASTVAWPCSGALCSDEALTRRASGRLPGGAHRHVPSGDVGFVTVSEAHTLAVCIAEPSGGSGCSTAALGWPVLVVLLLNRRRTSSR